MAPGWRYTKLSVLFRVPFLYCARASLRVCYLKAISISRPCIRVSASYSFLSLLAFSFVLNILLYFLFCFVLFVPFFSWLFYVLCSRWSFVDVPLIFSYPGDHVLDWQSRVLLGIVEALLSLFCRFCLIFVLCCIISLELCRCSFDIFLSSRPPTTTGLATIL